MSTRAGTAEIEKASSVELSPAAALDKFVANSKDGRGNRVRYHEGAVMAQG